MTRLSRRSFLGLASGAVLAAVPGYSMVAVRDLKVNRVDVPCPGLPTALDRLRLGVMADFHVGDYVSPDFVARAAELMNSLEPDLILLPGDFVQNQDRQIEDCAKALSQLRAPLGTLACLGNHEYWVDTGRAVETLAKAGIDTLVNQSRTIVHNDTPLAIAGLDSALRGRPNPAQALAEIPRNTPTLIMVHEPDYADTLATLPQTPLLQISGHSHGGQVRLPIIGAPILPPLGQRYPIGLQTTPNSSHQIFTTTGVGDFYPIRLHCPPEVAVVRLRAA